MKRYLQIILLTFLMMPPCLSFSQRVTLSLNGNWKIGESVEGDHIPRTFEHEVPVPGLVRLATPSFPLVDEFYSNEMVGRFVMKFGKVQLPADLDTTGLWQKRGVTRQKRNYFWYQKEFKAPDPKQVAILRIGKAQFGTAVWVNGKKVGEQLNCFTSGSFNISDALLWGKTNTVLVRIGAHPDVLPAWVPTGMDYEKLKWTPGIYDEVSVSFSDNPVITKVQIAPRIETGEILVQTTVRNYGKKSVSTTLDQVIKTWKEKEFVSDVRNPELSLEPGEEKTVTRLIPVPNHQLWSPENPFLYELESTTSGDNVSTRFGMREFHFETATGKAYLNGKIYYMRGSNICLHRFFEDEVKNMKNVWDEAWVRKLLVDIPKQMHWNSFRYCVGPVPKAWLDIADEAGLLIQNEFFIWSGGNDYRKEWTKEVMVGQFREWMEDTWNHPSVVIWDACNETEVDILGNEVIPEVRPLDLSGRPWENGWNLPVGPDDPMEDHPYHRYVANRKNSDFRPEILEETAPVLKQKPDRRNNAHAKICNEYGWFWLNRDGSPTQFTENVFEMLTGEDATAEQRLEAQAYFFAAETEYFRAHRTYAAVLHFVYLSNSQPLSELQVTADNFKDVVNLKLRPQFANYMSEAFKPVGVYLNFWHPTIDPGIKKDFLIFVINDKYESINGKLRLTMVSVNGGDTIQSDSKIFIPSNGQNTYRLTLDIPEKEGTYLLKASAIYDNGKENTISRRRVYVGKLDEGKAYRVLFNP